MYGTVRSLVDPPGRSLGPAQCGLFQLRCLIALGWRCRSRECTLALGLDGEHPSGVATFFSTPNAARNSPRVIGPRKIDIAIDWCNNAGPEFDGIRSLLLPAERQQWENWDLASSRAGTGRADTRVPTSGTQSSSHSTEFAAIS